MLISKILQTTISELSQAKEGESYLLGWLIFGFVD